MAYTPASNTTGTASLRHLATVYYKKTALDQFEEGKEYYVDFTPAQ